MWLRKLTFVVTYSWIHNVDQFLNLDLKKQISGFKLLSVYLLVQATNCGVSLFCFCGFVLSFDWLLLSDTCLNMQKLEI